jgi:hypothetical protein
MKKTTLRVLLSLLVWGVMAGTLCAADGLGKGKSGLGKEKSTTAKDKAAATRKNPIDDAFALPKGVTLAGLRDDQRKAYNKLRDDKTPLLQGALDRKRDAATKADENKLAKEVLKIRSEIKDEIKKILLTPNPNAPKNPPKNQQPQRNAKPPKRH